MIARIVIVKDGKGAIVDLANRTVIQQTSTHISNQEILDMLGPFLTEFLKPDHFLKKP